jgi:predicted  nucleic acid-binding Zn-ribbon protein
MRVIDQLAALQVIDSKLDADRSRYAEIQAALQPPDSLQEAESTRDETVARLEHWRGEQRQRETAVKDQKARIQAQEKQLYGGRVKDPREQVALAKNVESLKKHLDTLEEVELEAILEVEQAESDLVEAEIRFGEEQAGWAQKEAELQQERQALIIHARQLKSQRQPAANRLQPAMLKRYETLRKKLGGVAVAVVNGVSCGGCGAALPTALRQQVHGSDVLSCPICGRMLVDR